MSPDVVVTEFIDEDTLAPLREAWSVVYDENLHADRPRLLAAAAEARALIVRNQTIVDAELLDAAPDLVAVGRLGVGLDNIDLAACSDRGVTVLPAVGANAIAVAEYVMGALLTMVRGAFGASGRVAGGEWPRLDLVGGELSGKTLGLVGHGAIAREVARRARSFGMEIFAYDPYLPDDHDAWSSATRSEFATLIEDCDAISIHVPLTDETKNLFDESALARMKPHAVLVNTSRGGVVDEDALAAALREHRIGGAALDVFADEPLSGDAGARFAGLDNVILTPHIAGLTVEAGTRVGEMTVANVLAALRGPDES